DRAGTRRDRPSVDGASRMSESSAILAAMYEGNTDALAALLAARPELDVFEAAAVGDAARIRQLVRARPPLVEAVSGDGWTALHLAAYFGQGEAVERLLAAGADPRVPSRNRLANTPLHAALAGRANARILTALRPGRRGSLEVRGPQGGLSRPDLGSGQGVLRFRARRRSEGHRRPGGGLRHARAHGVPEPHLVAGRRGARHQAVGAVGSHRAHVR